MVQTTLFNTPPDQNPSKMHEVHPFIISASRATDIPSFYMDWFFERYKEGYVLWNSPYNTAFIQKVWFDKVHAVIFWTKDPWALYRQIPKLNQCPFLFYVQITLNDYERDIEPAVPLLCERILGFQKLSQSLGAHRVIWRYDPLFLSDTISLFTLCSRVERLVDTLSRYTEKLIISFIQIEKYKRVQAFLSSSLHNGVREFTSDEKYQFIVFLKEIEKKYQIKIHICCEEKDPFVYSYFSPGNCIDPDLLLRLVVERSGEDNEFRTYLHHARKDPGQRKRCSCIHAKDIGQYSSCLHFCRYCYANASEPAVRARYQAHKDARDQRKDLPSLIPKEKNGCIPS
jgi:DNA repair photolyase